MAMTRHNIILSTLGLRVFRHVVQGISLTSAADPEYLTVIAGGKASGWAQGRLVTCIHHDTSLISPDTVHMLVVCCVDIHVHRCRGTVLQSLAAIQCMLVVKQGLQTYSSTAQIQSSKLLCDIAEA